MKISHRKYESVNIGYNKRQRRSTENDLHLQPLLWASTRNPGPNCAVGPPALHLAIQFLRRGPINTGRSAVHNNSRSLLILSNISIPDTKARDSSSNRAYVSTHYTLLLLTAEQTSLSWHRRIRATRCISAQRVVCDKQTTVVGRLLTTLATIHVPWRNFSDIRVRDNVPEGILLFLQIPEFLSPTYPTLCIKYGIKLEKHGTTAQPSV